MPNTQHCPRCGAALAAFGADTLCPKCMVADAFGAADPPPPLQPSTPSEPRARGFGDYELIEEIARGGMGVVWKARQLRLNRLVAVKMILSGPYAGKEYIARFQTEAEAAAKLQHSNIVAVHEVGQHEGHHYFSMEYVEGQNLAQLVRDQPLSAVRAANYVKIVAEAIHYAHQRGILHRDLKPSNILIDAADRPRVTDFGVAKIVESQRELRVEGAGPAGDSASLNAQLSNSQLTATGQVLGTPNYMPPEQARGNREELGPPSDVYSLGGILFYLLTGRAPFVGESLEDTLQQVLTREPVSPRALRSSVPRELDTICLKCLAKEPGRRYPTALELAEDLGRWLRHEPIRARPATVTKRVFKVVRRHPISAGLVAAILVSLVLGWVAARQSHSATEQRRQREEANVRRQLQSAENHFAGDNAHLGLAVLAHVLRDDPANRVAAERLVNTLRQRVFLIPHEAESPSAVTGALTRLNVAESQSLLTSPATILASTPKVTNFQSAIRSPPSTIVPSPDGKCLLLGCETNTITVRDAATGQTLLVITQAHDRVIRSLGWSPDGRRLVSAGADHTAKVWDARGGIPLLVLPHSEAVYHAEFSPDGHRVVTASYDGSVRVWAVKDGALVSQMHHLEAANTARFSADGRHVISASDDGTARIWSAETGQPASEPFRQGQPTDKSNVRPLAVDDTWFHRDGGHVTIRLETGTNLSFRFSQGLTLLRHFVATSNSQPANATALLRSFSPDGTIVATATDTTVTLLDQRTGQSLAAPLVHEAAVNCIRFSPDSRRLATSTAGKRVRLWDARTGAPLSDWIDSPQRIVGVQFSADNAWLESTAGWRWQIHVARGSAPSWLPELAEATAGLRIDDTGQQVAVAPGAISRTREMLMRSPTNDALAAWAKAFLTEESNERQR